MSVWPRFYLEALVSTGPQQLFSGAADLPVPGRTRSLYGKQRHGAVGGGSAVGEWVSRPPPPLPPRLGVGLSIRDLSPVWSLTSLSYNRLYSRQTSDVWNFGHSKISQAFEGLSTVFRAAESWTPLLCIQSLLPCLYLFFVFYLFISPFPEDWLRLSSVFLSLRPPIFLPSRPFLKGFLFFPFFFMLWVCFCALSAHLQKQRSRPSSCFYLFLFFMNLSLGRRRFCCLAQVTFSALVKLSPFTSPLVSLSCLWWDTLPSTLLTDTFRCRVLPSFVSLSPVAFCYSSLSATLPVRFYGVFFCLSSAITRPVAFNATLNLSVNSLVFFADVFTDVAEIRTWTNVSREHPSTLAYRHALVGAEPLGDGLLGWSW